LSKTAAEHNFDHFMERGPGLSYGYKHYIVGYDHITGTMILGGLGGMGVGTLEYKNMTFDSLQRYKNFEGFDIHIKPYLAGDRLV
jgi:hypothetical protein